MRRLLYLIALILAILTAITYVIAKDQHQDYQEETTRLNKQDQLALWRTQAAQGNPEAQYQLALYYDQDQNNYLEAVKYYRIAAHKGNHAGAQFMIAYMHLYGLGVENDPSTAMRYLQLAAKGGDPRAYFFLGVAARDGWEEKADWIEAYKWFLLAQPDQEEIITFDKRINPAQAVSELKAVMSDFNRQEAERRAAQWRKQLPQ